MIFNNSNAGQKFPFVLLRDFTLTFLLFYNNSVTEMLQHTFLAFWNKLLALRNIEAWKNRDTIMTVRNFLLTNI